MWNKVDGINRETTGGAAVIIYSDNAYESDALDLVTSEGKKALQATVQSIGFKSREGLRMFQHSGTEWYVEFPTGPLGFGDAYVNAEDSPLLKTQYAEFRIITPTLSAIDRLAAFWYHFDRQTWGQAIEVAKRHPLMFLMADVYLHTLSQEPKNGWLAASSVPLQ